ncbi:hypothetical protein [Undibacterium sp. Ji22W]|uniref:hypothetical protein n=1 Tax=Undibacterium sp. Ji22W TaxID=3413038 RepID=UPI003BF3AC17
MRQNVVAWTENLSWGWHNGERAFWNTQHWDSGSPLSRVNVDHALLDTFLDTFLAQDKYSIGDYTASKIIYTHSY